MHLAIIYPGVISFVFNQKTCSSRIMFSLSAKRNKLQDQEPGNEGSHCQRTEDCSYGMFCIKLQRMQWETRWLKLSCWQENDPM